MSEEILMKIIEQQRELREISEDNSCLLVFDDIYTSQLRHAVALNKLFQSGRHFNCSIITSCVSWSDIAPSCRRSLDFVILYSNITLSDTQFLTRNFLNKNLIQTARYALKTNRLYTGLVIQTSPEQKLYLLKFKKKGLDHKNTDLENTARSSKNDCLETKSLEQVDENGSEEPTEKKILEI